ncbi:tRNA (adenine(22)-N(1))-methyltransferase TrmK [Carnobacterium divergens]|uniref:tRNA (Adenine(22)-N(1))-methyltransferase TrmK n=1 Tax=Carnobacterium divergens TaxID=2748 RepID=A0A7Z8CZ01_CARDV|nr:tRNA (adenine(22)-N(1))-methyltransferase TrmK [Carnobacterium divergens]TFI71335.1 tRNA (adenine(22)-N(1))-methyltransferase TrmK [Carnobacterium divergens]TFI75977.1 tRNA (adenine(22)-N(1))-methyltransferase TrmK [Carnobacterium divergens]TFI81849.1 tRNA (adenine(22)-N(1))-methyltransferase TrmK [Carnobacterium divergens]TFI94158.1 tRNA (adenine(22)-N(1))-methyltransferase TrmK [Carnobacterium divergens]TFJ10438.1 tRNA (adenine(22)-N(1))-methyltransferase TrmK [Carnobacterium divergens]
MDEKQLSMRLAKAAAYVPKKARLADIGSDHAYLPCALTLNHQIDFAIAGEVVIGPFQTAKEQVERLKLTNTIDVRLGNGLDVLTLEDKITAITICGMGGSLIASILENGIQKKQLSGKERLILQPNIGEYTLRNWLMNHSYKIIAEELIEEDQKKYEIIIAEKSEQVQTYTDQELKYGVFLKNTPSTIFIDKWQSELEKKQTILASLKKSSTDQSEKIQRVEREMKEIEELIQ